MLLKSKKISHGFTLVEIMIVVAIIALLAAIAVPGFLRSRKRSQAAKITLAEFDVAMNQGRSVLELKPRTRKKLA